jgi:P27 family predicted phage terminase small subunit
MTSSSAQPERRPKLAVAQPPKPPAPPKHLRAGTRRWWREIVSDYSLESHHLRLLEVACRTWDRLEEAGEALRRDGLTVTTNSGSTKAHPCVAIERDSRIAFARILREMDLEAEPLPDPRQPRRRG